MINGLESSQLYLALFLGVFSGAILAWAILSSMPAFLKMRRAKIREHKLKIEKERTALEEELRRLKAIGVVVARERAADQTKSRPATRSSETEKAIDNERLRMAHELHDDIVQRMAAVRLRMEEFSYRLDKPELLDGLSALSEEMNQIMKSLRFVIYGLPQPQFEEGSFSSLIRDFLVTRLNRVAARTVEFHLEHEEREFFLPMQVKRELYALIQEAVQNSLKHSAGFRLALSIVWSNMLEIEITDNGQGYLSKASTTEGLGFTSMEERARGIGAKLSLLPSTYGAVVKISVPNHFSK